MFDRLTSPFKRRFRKYADRVSGFIDPIKSATSSLRAKVTIPERLKSFKQSLKEMSDFQKLILLTIAICLPMGILISTLLVGFLRKRKK